MELNEKFRRRLFMFILTLGSISALITFGCAVIETKNKKQ
jgi:hypothetical protein